jgi:D-alanyl-D-alanine carboxypeptidase
MGHRSWIVLAGITLTACASGPTDQPSGGPASSSASTEQAAAGSALGLDDRVAAAEQDMAVYDGIVTGISMAIAQDGEVRTFVHGKAVTDPDQRFMVASLSKPMVATALLSLVADGRLSLEDTVEELAPGLLPRAPQVTVEQLLSMTSGLPDYQAMASYAGPFTTSSEGLVAMVARKPLAFEPGSQGGYVNTNFAVLDVLVQRITGHDLAALLDRAVLRPAHLRHTSLGDQPDLPGTTSEDRPYRPRIIEPSAAAGIVASAGDVAAFLEALTDGALLPPDLVADMEAEHSSVDFGSYGLGIAIEETPCGTAYGHVGNNDGFEAAGWTVPEVGRTVVVLVNASNVEAAQSLVAHALCD